MTNFEKLYFLLFNAITDALSEMETMNFGNASNILKQAQSDSESAYIECEE